MIAEALKFIFAEAKERQNPAPHVRPLSGHRQAVTLLGQTEIEELDPPKLCRYAESIESVAHLVEEFRGSKPTIFINLDGLRAILDDDDRRETVEMVFSFSPQFRALEELSSGVTQRKLVRVLRTTLSGCVNHDGIIAMARQIEFNVDVGNRATINHLDESMGRSVNKQVRAQAGDIPEELRMTLPLLSVPADVNTTIDLTVAVDIDMDQEKISLTPVGDQLERERQRIATAIAEKVDSLTDAIVVQGSVR